MSMKQRRWREQHCKRRPREDVQENRETVGDQRSWHYQCLSGPRRRGGTRRKAERSVGLKIDRQEGAHPRDQREVQLPKKSTILCRVSVVSKNQGLWGLTMVARSPALK